jgi:hypothetical protein
MPKTTQSTSQASSSRAQSSHPTIEQREILFETEFDINGDFKNFEATQWAIQEFKRRGLKKLFNPVTSTAYTRFVICKLKGLNVQHSALITPPNLHIASPLVIQNKK